MNHTHPGHQVHWKVVAIQRVPASHPAVSYWLYWVRVCVKVNGWSLGAGVRVYVRVGGHFRECGCEFVRVGHDSEALIIMP